MLFYILIEATATAPSTPQRPSINVQKTTQINSLPVTNAALPKRQSAKVQSSSSISVFNRSDMIPVIVPRNNPRVEQVAESRKEGVQMKTVPLPLQSKTSDLRKYMNVRDNLEMSNVPAQSDTEFRNAMDLSASDRSTTAVTSSVVGAAAAEKKAKDDKLLISGKVNTSAAFDNLARYQNESYQFSGNNENPDTSHLEGQKGGRRHSLVSNWEQKERSSYRSGLTSGNVSGKLTSRGYPLTGESESVSASDEDAIADLMEMHNQFVGSMQSRLAKLQMVLNYWRRQDIKGALSAISKMADHSVVADVISLLAEKTDTVTLDICTCLLPLLSGLVESDTDRHQEIALDMLLKLVRVFGSVIYSSLSASSSVGVDIEAEQRLGSCFILIHL
ncbi:hypothetical protein RD792_011348 [Penstemon davidsonii]|uniref:Katanin p80 subunit C-terminal domain-containing protein n=1 Tax=Penstemon davidsonii TaxID=160366 RepID=A0ABR0D4C6_9LAMI|nr:hypothetical protein RD792_011338 [Penstemon davidsonii]KAK4484128.1 hypothetical protein RD792_011348 [Penstemon davidsonii]